jgi:hypothetical protein
MTIYEAIEAVVSGLTYNETEVSYIYGSPKEIQKRQVEWMNDTIMRSKRFPCVCLFTPVVGTVQLSGDTDYDCNMVFLAQTDKNYSTVQRLENVYKPILHPLVNDFLKALKASKYLSVDYEAGWEQSDVFFSGENENTLSAELDAVEIKKIKIKLFKNCNT